jgi:hypothetical protein
MVRRPTPSQPEDRILSPSEMRSGIDRLRLRIQELKALDPQSVSDYRSPEIVALQVSIEDALAATFGHRTSKFTRYRSAADLEPAHCSDNHSRLARCSRRQQRSKHARHPRTATGSYRKEKSAVDLRYRVTERLSLDELEVVWFDLFNRQMRDEIDARNVALSSVALIDRSRRMDILNALCRNYPFIGKGS